MIIKSLKLHNFGVYAGDNEFVFDGKKPIVLIGGMNGRGKTTFLEAILLALYGSNSFAYIESDYKAYTQYLRSYVNRDAIDNLCWVELQFEVQAGIEIESYRIVREWEGFSKRLNEVIRVYKDGEYSEFLTNNWPMFVENILPSALSNLFVFDGEKIADLAVDTSNEQLKKAVRSMLGISVLDVLKNDVLRNLKKVNKDNVGTNINDELNLLREEKNSLSALVESLSDQLQSIQIELDANNSKRDLLIQEYASKGGKAEEKKHETMQKKSDCTSELSLLNNKLLECASGDLPLLLVSDLLADINTHALEENEDRILRRSLKQIEKLHKSYCKNRKVKDCDSAAFIDYVKDTVNSQNVEQIYGLSDYSIFQLANLIDKRKDDLSSEIVGMLSRKHQLTDEINKYDSYLNLDISSQELSDINNEIRKVEEEIVKNNVRLAKIKNDISEQMTRLKEKTQEFNLALDTYLSSEEYHDSLVRTTMYSEMIIKVVERYMVELQKKKADLLGTTITKCYKKLASKKKRNNAG